VVNVDRSMYLRIKTNPVLFRLSRFFLDRDRHQALTALPDSILVHDVRKGLPFGDGTADAVYHSHFLPHLDRELVPGFLAEARRVLKPGGIHRIVVLNLEKLCADYLAHVRLSETETAARAVHDDYIARIIELMVRKEAWGTSQQKPVRRFLENRLLGDARKRGESCQWMYDGVNLPQLLEEAGYQSMSLQHFDISQIPGWNDYGLDRNGQGGEYKPGSVYVEAMK
jgi:predicted SAM-dependent methyltransferase